KTCRVNKYVGGRHLAVFVRALKFNKYPFPIPPRPGHTFTVLQRADCPPKIKAFSNLPILPIVDLFPVCPSLFYIPVFSEGFNKPVLIKEPIAPPFGKPDTFSGLYSFNSTFVIHCIII